MSKSLFPMQPIYLDDHGVVRFVANGIVRFLLDAGPFDMNMLAQMPFEAIEYEQFAQLIGYSVGGFSELSYASPEMIDFAQGRADTLVETPDG